jgi:transposase
MMRGGREQVRCVLYLAAPAAIRYDVDLKTFYDRPIVNEVPVKLALTAVMRRMIVPINALPRRRRHWQPVAP